MAANIDDILNPKPEPDSAEELITAVLERARLEDKALTKQEILQACRINWFDVAKPGEGGLVLAIGMAYLAHETGIRKQFDSEREAALERLVEKGLVRSQEHQGELHYWIDDPTQLAEG